MTVGPCDVVCSVAPLEFRTPTGSGTIWRCTVAVLSTPTVTPSSTPDLTPDDQRPALLAGLAYLGLLITGALGPEPGLRSTSALGGSAHDAQLLYVLQGTSLPVDRDAQALQGDTMRP